MVKKRSRVKRKGRRLFGALALAAGAVGTTLLLRRRGAKKVEERQESALDHLTGAAGDRWARPGMEVTLRAELRPGRDRSERTFRVAEVLPSGRVRLVGVSGEHTESEFEPLRRR